MPKNKSCVLCGEEWNEKKYHTTFCNDCLEYPFCPNCIKNTAICVHGAGPWILKNVSLCNKCYRKRRPKCLDCDKNALNRCIYCNGPLCSSHKEHQDCLNNPEWEAKKREEYMKAAEEKWAQLLKEKTADELRKNEVADEYHIRDNTPAN